MLPNFLSFEDHISEIYNLKKLIYVILNQKTNRTLMIYALKQLLTVYCPRKA